VGISDVNAARDLSRGIAGMMSRVRALNGRFDIDTSPDGGTRVRIFVPLAA
jgi:signal transduction histidine kinase